MAKDKPLTHKPSSVIGKRHQPRGTAAKRGYNHRWQRASKAFLHANPLCVECERDGKLVPARAVDHKVPHRGDQRLFWDRANWQAMCLRCHNRKTARGE